MTNVRVLGYVFNPVSFYYCYDESDSLKAVVCEVNNTFQEQKLYLALFEKKGVFKTKAKKYFYVSPFIDFSTDFYFSFREPEETVWIEAKSFDSKGVILKAFLKGIKQPLNPLAILNQFVKVPFVTLKIIFLIHWQAMKLYFMKVNYYSKEDIDLKIKQIGHAHKIKKLKGR